ncbi:MAG: glycosyltransferase family 4 protein [Desulfurivibrionaceae bacterium]
MNPRQTEKDMKIAIVSDSFPPSRGGGVATSHYNLFSVFKNRGYCGKAFTYRDGGVLLSTNEEDVSRAGLPTLLIKFLTMTILVGFRVVSQRRGGWQFAGAITGAIGGFLLRRKIRRFNPDILVLPDHGACGVFLPKSSSYKTVLISHHNPARFVDEPLTGNHSKRDADWTLKLEEIVLAKVDGVICPSHYMKDTFLRTYSFSGPVAVIPNLVDIAMIEQVPKSLLHEKIGLSEETPIVYIPSAGSIFKGSKFVFEIIRRLATNYEKDVGFYMSGDIGDELSRMLDFVPSNVHLITPGQIPYNENIANIKSCSLCVSPTLSESFGMAILEAQLCCLPVVSFDVGGNRDIIREGATGYLVPFMDIEKLINLANKLLCDREMCLKMGDEAKEHSLEDFDPNLLCDKYVSFFEDL